MRKKSFWTVAVVLISLLMSSFLGAQEAENGTAEVFVGEPDAGETVREVVLERAERVRYDSLKNIFEALGNVRAIQGQNLIETQEMEYNLETNTGVFRGGVVVTREATVIRSETMDGDFDAELYLFQGGVELTKERQEEEGTSTIFWKAQEISFDGNTEEAWSEGAAEITWKEVNISAQRVHYFPADEGAGTLERMAFEGEVIITEQEREILAERAVYYLADEVLEAENIIRARFIIED
ncbi:MAG TPA: hypothetical protein VLH40_03930 [Atribacteraceae bacterium]|nr:hypothetical protein [Atribacteraceae bacterium]